MNANQESGTNVPEKARGKVPDWYFFLSLFCAGMVTMAVEFGASRLLGNFFGTSNIVWAVIIGLVLVYLTLGNWLGGKLADKFPYQGVFFNILAYSGFFVGVIPLASRPILRTAANAFDSLAIPVLAGSFVVVLVLFFIPVTLLGMVVPFGLRLQIHTTQESGRISGRVSAISTLGSFLGSFLTVLVAIPLIGTYRTFIAASILLLVISVPGFWYARQGKNSLVALGLLCLMVLILLVGLSGTDKNTEGLVFEDESAYNYIQVLEVGGFRFLRLNEGQGMHSIYHPEQLFYGGPWSQVLTAPYFNPTNYDEINVKNIAILGLAAGTTARQAYEVYPNAHVDGFELDPEIIAVGREWFGMNLPNLSAFAQDARWGIAHSDRVYDIINIDAYKPPYIPAHLVTSEFFELVSSKLTENGVMVINVARSPLDRSLVESIGATAAEVFPKIFAVDIPESYNTVLFATKNPEANWEYFTVHLAEMEAKSPNSLLTLAMRLTITGKTEFQAGSVIFTDDKAPIEYLTNKMVMDFILGEELETRK